MDCEKCESLLMDELYGELDDVTSAAVKRHVAGCASCAASLAGMRGARGVLPLVTPPIHLEHAILARVAEAEKSLPTSRKAGALLSRAGRWAMRPQTAMAALLLVIVGTSTVFIGTKPAYREASRSPVAMDQSPVELAAAPAAAASAVAAPPGDLKLTREPTRAGPTGPSGRSNDSTLESAAVADNVQEKKKAGDESLEERARRPQANRAFGGDPEAPQAAAPPPPAAVAPPRVAAAKAAAPSGAARPSTRPMAAAEFDDGASNLGTGGMAAATKTAPATQPAPQPAATAARKEDKDQRASSPMDRGMDAYKANKFGEATREFESAERSGNSTAALWTAKSVMAEKGCSAAAPRFDEAAQKLRGSALANDATLSAADCYASIGNFTLARARYEALKSIEAYRARAQAGLARVDAAERAARTRSPQPAATQSPAYE